LHARDAAKILASDVDIKSALMKQLRYKAVEQKALSAP
jgi:hypothetical protein